MAIDSTLAVRRALMTAMKADTALTALVPAARIYPQVPDKTPTWPFVRYGSPTSVPLRASCLDGAEHTIAIHAFAKQRKQGQSAVETAEDHAARIGAAIARALDARTLTVDGGKLKVNWRGSQLLIDGDERDAFHAVVNFRVRAMTA